MLWRLTVTLALTVHRFGTVVCPFRYPRHSTKVAAVIFTVGSVYSVAMAASLALAVNSFDYCSRRQDDGKCTFPGCLCTVYYIILTVTVILCIVVPLILNVVLFYKVKQLTCGTIGNVKIGEARRTSDIRGKVTFALLISSVVLTFPSIVFHIAKSFHRIDVTSSPLLALLDVLLSDLHALLPTADALVVWRNTEVTECTKSLYRRSCKIFKPVTVN